MQVPGQDSPGLNPASTTRACVASLHRCQGKILRVQSSIHHESLCGKSTQVPGQDSPGPIQHPPREPVWQVYTGARARFSGPNPASTTRACVASLHRCQGKILRAQSSIHHESLCGKSTQVPGQDSPGPNPASTTRACVASLHRCQGKILRAQSSIHHESLCGKSTQVPGQDSPGPNPASTTRACVASLHRCQGKILRAQSSIHHESLCGKSTQVPGQDSPGPIQHQPREPVWQVYTGARTILSRAQSSIHHESLCGKSTQVPGQDSPGPNPASTTRACVASLHRCQDKTLQGPTQHPPREPAWQVYTGARTRLSRAQPSIHHESLRGKSTQVPGQDSPGPNPASTTRACVASLHRCQGKTLQGPIQHPPREPVWQV